MPGFTASSVLSGNFRLEQQLGRGGMGEAWKAYDLTAERYVVLKFVPKEIQHVKAAMDGMRDSFKKVHELQHQHICPVYGLFNDPEHGIYLVMKFIDGMPLDEYKLYRIEKHGGMSFSDSVQILWGIAKGLDYAHEMKVIHRDIKPQNIMIGRKEGVQIIDFGLAEEIRTSMAKFSDVEMDVVGTRPYMAPEQWKGRMQEARTDQYALAATAYELFADHPPFYGSDVGVLRECVLNDAPEPITGIPEHVNAALFKALAKKREDRFPDCKSFVKALVAKPKAGADIQQSAAPSLPPDPEAGKTPSPVWLPSITVTPTPKSEKPKPVRSKNGLFAGIAAGAVCVVLFGLVFLLSGKPLPQPNVASTTKTETPKKAPSLNDLAATLKKEPMKIVEPAPKPQTVPVEPKQPTISPDRDHGSRLGTEYLVSDDEKRLLQQQYPELDWVDANMIVLPKPTKDDLNQAFYLASESKANDIIVVRTTKENHRHVLNSGPFSLEYKAKDKGSVALVALGPEKLILDGDKKDRIFIVQNGVKADFGGIVFTNGQIVDKHGGAVYVNENSTARFFHCDFIDNVCVAEKKSAWTALGGGGITVARSSVLVLQNVLFEKNQVRYSDNFEGAKTADSPTYPDSPGGLFVWGKSSVKATNVVFRNNYGGGMYLHNVDAAELRNISLIDNKSEGSLGTAHLQGNNSEQTYHVVNLFATGNSNGHIGNTLRLAGKGRFLLDHLTFVDNEALGYALCFGGGGDAVLLAPEVTLSNSLVVGNRGKYYSTDIGFSALSKAEKSTIRNCIVDKNPDRVSQFFQQAQNTQFLKLADVKFGPLKDFGNGLPVMPLLPGSPAIDAGIATETTPTTDITDSPRNVGKAPDIGAFEWQP